MVERRKDEIEDSVLCSAHEPLEVMMISQPLNLPTTAVAVVTPVLKCFDNSQSLFVVRIGPGLYGIGLLEWNAIGCYTSLCNRLGMLPMA